MPDDKLPQRTLNTTFWVASFFTLIFAARGQGTIAFGLAIGAGIGLLSLLSLILVVPRLFRPGNPAAKFLLGTVAFMKLPLYAVVLNFAMVSPHVAPFAVFIGAALVPAVLVFKVLGYQALQKMAPVGEKACPSESSN